MQCGEALLTAGLIERFFSSPFNLDRLRHVLGLLGAAIIATAVSGIGGTLGFALFHGAPASSFVTWQNWFASDALGIITIAPLIIGLASATREPPARNETIEGLVALASLVVMSVIVIALPPEPWTTVVPIALLFPVLLWIAARCRPVFAAAAAFIVTLAIVWTTTIGIGHFGDPGLPMADRVLAARAGILAVALCAYVLAALFAERRQHEAALAESEARLQEALTAGAVTTFVWDVGTRSSQRSANAAQILGFDPRQSLPRTIFSRECIRTTVSGSRRSCAVSSPNAPPIPSPSASSTPTAGKSGSRKQQRPNSTPSGRLVRLQGLTLDVTARKRSEEQQSLLIAALDHRVKNLLARVAAVAKDMRHGSDLLDDYIRALDRRMQSMAGAHALLSQNCWDGVDLAELVRRQLAPNGTDANTTLGGPNIMLPVAATQTLAMVLHELATNAAKYGALSTPHGRVDVNWNREPGEDAAHLSIAWREVGGPAVAPRPTADTASASFAISSRKSSAVQSTFHSHPAGFAAK